MRVEEKPSATLTIRYVPLPEAHKTTLDDLHPGLTADERERVRNLHRLEDKVAFAAGRALVRQMLSSLAETPPEGWRFTCAPRGKPYLRRTVDQPDLRFNLAHTRGLLVAVVALGREVGIDTEHLTEQFDCVAIARAHFSCPEIQALEQLEARPQREAFFALWTIREAYGKAWGEGITGAAVKQAFSLDPLSVLPMVPSSPNGSDWFLWRDQPSPLHFVAVATEQRPHEKLCCVPEQLSIDDLLTS